MSLQSFIVLLSPPFPSSLPLCLSPSCLPFSGPLSPSAFACHSAQGAHLPPPSLPLRKKALGAWVRAWVSACVPVCPADHSARHLPDPPRRGSRCRGGHRRGWKKICVIYGGRTGKNYLPSKRGDTRGRQGRGMCDGSVKSSGAETELEKSL